jgi:hypothetical protein
LYATLIIGVEGLIHDIYQKVEVGWIITHVEAQFVLMMAVA